MQKRLEHFMLGTLWLLAATLGACFWFNVRFGFNLLSGAHWKYLGVLQATNTSVDRWFYLSLFLTVTVMLGGLYILIRPRFRKFEIWRPKPKPQNVPANTIQNVPVQTPIAVANSTQSLSTMGMTRPPRLNLPTHNNNNYIAAQPAAAQPVINNNFTSDPKKNIIPSKEEVDMIYEIFSDAGYTVKTPPRIGNLRPALWATGSDEVLYVGAIGASPANVAAAADKLRALFTETLSDDIQIKIRTFTIGDFDDLTATAANVMVFESPAELRSAIPQNRELPADETEDFDAYNEFIDTVTEYFNNN